MGLGISFFSELGSLRPPNPGTAGPGAPSGFWVSDGGRHTVTPQHLSSQRILRAVYVAQPTRVTQTPERLKADREVNRGQSGTFTTTDPPEMSSMLKRSVMGTRCVLHYSFYFSVYLPIS